MFHQTEKYVVVLIDFEIFKKFPKCFWDFKCLVLLDLSISLPQTLHFHLYIYIGNIFYQLIYIISLLLTNFIMFKPVLDEYYFFIE